jgi:hypothetical protein
VAVAKVVGTFKQLQALDNFFAFDPQAEAKALGASVTALLLEAV